MLREFESPADMARFAARVCSSQQAWNNSDQSWSGVNASGLSAMLEKGGDESDVPAALALLDKLSALLPETDRAVYAPSVSGAYPCVPDAIIGLPKSMRRKVADYSNNAPIRVGVVTTVSAAIDRDAFRKKAAAMLAILMHLNNSGRAVELYGVSILHGADTGETVITYRIASNPVSLAECNMALGNLAFARRIPFAIGEKLNSFNGEWPTQFSTSDMGADYCARLGKRLGFQMLLPPLYESESRAIKADPAEWMLAKYAAIQAQIESGE